MLIFNCSGAIQIYFQGGRVYTLIYLSNKWKKNVYTLAKNTSVKILYRKKFLRKGRPNPKTVTARLAYRIEELDSLE